MAKPPAPIRTIITDDEEVAREGLKLLLSEKPDFQVVSVCRNGREAISEIAELRPELLLLDIRMPEISGFDVLERIPRDSLPVVIFITAYDEFAIKAFEMHAIDYILKPFSQDRLDKALERAKDFIRDKKISDFGKSLAAMLIDYRSAGVANEASGFGEPERQLERIMIRDNKRIVFVDVNDIDWIEGADYYTVLHSGEKSFLYRESLRNLESKLPPSRFLRIHMSAIVNLDKIEEIKEVHKSDYRVVMRDGKELRVSRRRKKRLFMLGAQKFGFRN